MGRGEGRAALYSRGYSHQNGSSFYTIYKSQKRATPNLKTEIHTLTKILTWPCRLYKWTFVNFRFFEKILKIIWGYPSFLEKFKNFWQKIEKKSGGILNKYFLGTIFPEICEKRGISRKAGDLTEIPRFSRESGGFQWNPPLFGGSTYTNPLGDVRTQIP